MRVRRLSEIRELTASPEFLGWWGQLVAARVALAENLTSFRKQHRDGFTFIIINIARMLSARLREANTRLAARL